MYIQLHMIIWHINCQFVVLHTCTQTFYIREMQEIFRQQNNNKRQYFFFLTFSDKCALQTRAFLTIISVQSARFVLFRATAVIVLFWSGSGSRYALKFQIGASTTSI